MQSDAPAFVPKVPPLPGPFPRRRRVLFLPAWVAVTLLLLLLAFVLVRNFQHDHRPHAQDSADLIQKERTAVAETKSAFSQVYAHKRVRAVSVLTVEPSYTAAGPKPKGVQGNTGGIAPAAPARPTAPLGRPGQNTLRGAASATSKSTFATGYGEEIANAAVEEWRSITASRAGRAGAWRRLGITLFLFNKPGGMTALRQIPRLPPPTPVPVAKSAMPRRVRERIAVPEVSTLPVAEEAALWETLYGPVGPHPAEIPALRAKLARLRLGWFEDIAAAQLYDRVGLTAEADRSAGQARNSANTLFVLLTFELGVRLLGMLLLVGFALAWVVRLIMRGQHQPSVQTVTSAHPIEEFYSPPSLTSEPAAILQSPLPVNTAEQSPVSYRARMIAFVVYFASFLLIAWPLRFLSPLLAHLSDRMALRVTIAIEIAAYMPITAITLLALKRIAESEQRRRITWRETLSAIGLRSDGLGRDTLTAVVTYTMTMPVLLLAAQVSSELLRNFHTPVHPVDLIILNTQDGFTRMLVLLQAAVGAPIVEELMFRGLLFQGLRERWGVWLAAILSSAVFALSHNTLPGGFLQLWTLGFVFAMVCHRNRSIFPNVLMHAIHNGLVSLVMFAVFSQ